MLLVNLTGGVGAAGTLEFRFRLPAEHLPAEGVQFRRGDRMVGNRAQRAELADIRPFAAGDEQLRRTAVQRENQSFLNIHCAFSSGCSDGGGTAGTPPSAAPANCSRTRWSIAGVHWKSYSKQSTTAAGPPLENSYWLILPPLGNTSNRVLSPIFR